VSRVRSRRARSRRRAVRSAGGGNAPRRAALGVAAVSESTKSGWRLGSGTSNTRAARGPVSSSPRCQVDRAPAPPPGSFPFVVRFVDGFRAGFPDMRTLPAPEARPGSGDQHGRSGARRPEVGVDRGRRGQTRPAHATAHMVTQSVLVAGPTGRLRSVVSAVIERNHWIARAQVGPGDANPPLSARSLVVVRHP
jgi:hypothetical protein